MCSVEIWYAMKIRDLAPYCHVSPAALHVWIVSSRIYHAQSNGVCSGSWLAFHEEAWNGRAHCCDDKNDVDDVERCLDARIEETHCCILMRFSSL
jgi:hypothetical protein